MLHIQNVLLAMTLVAFTACCHATCATLKDDGAALQRYTMLSDKGVEGLGQVAISIVQGRDVERRSLSEDLTNCAETAVYVDLRRNGRSAYARWGTGTNPLHALQNALATFRNAAQSASRPDAALINVAFNFRPALTRADFAELNQRNRGLLGVEVRTPDAVRRVAPTDIIARNTSFAHALSGISRSDVTTVRLFDADQIHIAFTGPMQITRLYRGAALVRIDTIDRTRVREMQELLTRWLFNNLDANGRLTYKFKPSSGQESNANNMIRQWMASNAMTHAARVTGNAAQIERVEQNIQYNLRHFYRIDADGKGVIVEQHKVKLGAVALAALTLIEHPARAKFAAQERALRATVDSLWRENGEFRTFLYPPHRNDNQNFYPGEALLLWATLYEESVSRGAPDTQLLDRIMRSFAYYRAWHLRFRNPAFVPWHTQAYSRVWRITKDPALLEFIFAMNDWLIDTMQQWDPAAEYPDTMGQFYTSAAAYGPPHASSTGVYLEGLADAWQLAKDVGDDRRSERYRRAIMRGLRSVIQLTFKNECDMFYSAHRERLVGGVKTTVYNNEVRVDNVQHNLRAILKILERFESRDYRP